MKLFLILTLILLCGCSETPLPPHPMQEIKGRDYNGTRFYVYRARVPLNWIRKDPLAEESLTDTTKALCEFFIPGNEGFIRIAIHNFPSNTLDERIPPIAQIARWQRQFDSLQTEESSTQPQAFNGYSGLKFKGIGVINNEDSMLLAWSLQLGKEHFQMLLNPKNPDDHDNFQEMRADVTIKATGPKSLMEDREEEIIAFARSFELIKEIPSRS